MASTVTDKSKSKEISSYFTKSPSKTTTNLAKKTVSAVSNASKSLATTSISPPKKKMKLSKIANDSDLLINKDELLDFLDGYDLKKKDVTQVRSNENKSSPQETKLSKNVNKSALHQHADDSSNSFPSYLYSVVNFEQVENGNSCIQIKLKQIQNSGQASKKPNKKEVETINETDSEFTTLCYLQDSWQVIV